ncbi:hypothetical protein LXA43DRAFT_1068847 [Ganoderma leucocontextum]|nr:hypothetical protein LXA43DRAFT_1068847 [Ganoderma leucocontextum]
MDSSFPVLPPPATPPRRPPKHSHQLVGEHFESPRRRRTWRGDSQMVEWADLAILEQRYMNELTQLLGSTNKSCVPDNDLPSSQETPEDGVADQRAAASDFEPLDECCEEETSVPKEWHPRRVLPDAAAYQLYNNWLALVPTLVPDYLRYIKHTQGRLGHLFAVETYSCPRGCRSLKDWDVQCLHFDCGPGDGEVSGLRNEPIQDPFRRGLGQAIQWYDALRRRPEHMLEQAVNECISLVTAEKLKALANTGPDTHLHGNCLVVGLYHSNPSSTEQRIRMNIQGVFRVDVRPGGWRTIAADVQANVGQGVWTTLPADVIPGAPMKSRADYGRNFENQHHNVAAGESPWFYEPKYFISKEQVDAMDARIATARSRPPRQHQSQVPESALDECEKSYEAADEKKEKTHGTKFDDTGLMALVCRHDIVLFLANVDTPGEQQKYGIALIDHLFTHLPEQATVVVFYDIGCVLDRSLHRFDILSSAIMNRLLFATSVMHAYGHQWACQLVYNPRLREGLGLTEGEGTERVWSKFRKLIGVTWSSANLSTWIRGRLKNGVEARGLAADEYLSETTVSVKELRAQWSQQREAQLSIKNHAPAKLKRELDAKAISEDASNTEAYRFFESLCRTHNETVGKVEELYSSLNVTDAFPEIQGLPLEFVRTLLMARDLKINIRKRAIGTFFEWDKLDRASGTKLHQQTRKAISKRTPALLTAIRKFNQYCATMKKLYKPEWDFPLPNELPEELNALWEDSSLLADVWVTRVTPTIPQWLEDADVRTGIRAVGSSGSIPIARGSARTVYARHRLPRAVRASWNAHDQDAHHSTSIPGIRRRHYPMEAPVPRECHTVQTKDRCLEEHVRLGMESDNLCRWYGLELAATELAMRIPRNAPILFLLKQQKEELLFLQFHWRTPLVSDIRFQAQRNEATRLAQKLSGSAEPVTVHWVHLSVPHEDEGEELYAPLIEEGDSEACLVHDVLEVIDNQELNRDHIASADPAPGLCNPTCPSPTLDLVAMPVIERQLWLSDFNPYPVRADSSLPLPPPPSNMPKYALESCKVAGDSEHKRGLTFDQAALERLHQPTAWLNDDCINFGSAVILRHLGTPTAHGDPALFPSWAFSKHQAGDDDTLWRACRQVPEFWNKSIWLIPIYRMSHWTLAIVYWQKHRIAYFDSLGSTVAFETDVKTVDMSGFPSTTTNIDGKPIHSSNRSLPLLPPYYGALHRSIFPMTA